MAFSTKACKTLVRAVSARWFHPAPMRRQLTDKTSASCNRFTFFDDLLHTFCVESRDPLGSDKIGEWMSSKLADFPNEIELP